MAFSRLTEGLFLTRLAWQIFLLSQLAAFAATLQAHGLLLNCRSRQSKMSKDAQWVRQCPADFVSDVETSMSSLCALKGHRIGTLSSPWSVKSQDSQVASVTAKKHIKRQFLEIIWVIWNPRWKYVNIQIRSSWFKFHGVEILSEHACQQIRVEGLEKNYRKLWLRQAKDMSQEISVASSKFWEISGRLSILFYTICYTILYTIYIFILYYCTLLAFVSAVQELLGLELLRSSGTLHFETQKALTRLGHG